MSLEKKRKGPPSAERRGSERSGRTRKVTNSEKSVRKASPRQNGFELNSDQALLRSETTSEREVRARNEGALTASAKGIGTTNWRVAEGTFPQGGGDLGN